MELYELTIAKAHDLLKRKEISSEELTKSVLARIEQVDGRIDAYLTVCADLAIQSARQADLVIASGDAPVCPRRTGSGASP